MNEQCFTRCPEVLRRQCEVKLLEQKAATILTDELQATVNHDNSVRQVLAALPESLAEEYIAGITAIDALRSDTAKQDFDATITLSEAKSDNSMYIADKCVDGPKLRNRFARTLGGHVFKCTSPVVQEIAQMKDSLSKEPTA